MEYFKTKKGLIKTSKKGVEVIKCFYGHTHVKPMPWLVNMWVVIDENPLVEFDKVHDISKVKYYKIVNVGDPMVTGEEWSAKALPDKGPGFPKWDGKYVVDAPTGKKKRFQVAGAFFPFEDDNFAPFLKCFKGICYPSETAEDGYWRYHPRRSVV